jgi:hypothetical protein
MCKKTDLVLFRILGVTAMAAAFIVITPDIVPFASRSVFGFVHVAFIIATPHESGSSVG